MSVSLFFVRLPLFEQPRYDLLADALAGRALACDVAFGINVLGHIELSVDGFGDGYLVVEGVPLESIERLLVLIAFEPLVLSEEHAYWKDHVHASVVVFVVVVLVRDAVDALQLVRVPRGYDDIVGVALAVSLDPCKGSSSNRRISRRRLSCRSRCRRS